MKRDVYEMVKDRSAGICERCGRARATEVHHKRLRSAGGCDSLLNLCHLCSACHTHTHAHVEESYRDEWLISAKWHGAEVARLYEVAE